MKCPSCSAEVEDGADLCLECGEPMGSARAAVVARTDPPVIAKSEETTAPVRKIDPPRVARRRVEEEPEAKRCPGCGIPTTRERCPGCGTLLRRSED